MKMLKPEFSRVVLLKNIPAAGLNFKEEATKEEACRLAERFKIPAVLSLKTQGKISGKNPVKVEGVFQASVVQVSSVSLKEFSSFIEQPFCEFFSKDGVDFSKIEEIDSQDLNALSEDVPEKLEKDEIDIGELVAQLLALELNPYPCAAGEKLSDYFAPSEEKEPKNNPFAVLEKLKKKS
jgi:uncharacterized metal-binding protein YceD (DUF177 family)